MYLSKDEPCNERSSHARACVQSLSIEVSPAEINRELTALKRMFSLAIQAGKLVHKPPFPMLRENNARVGFFEKEQYLCSFELLPTRSLQLSEHV